MSRPRSSVIPVVRKYADETVLKYTSPAGSATGGAPSMLTFCVQAPSPPLSGGYIEQWLRGDARHIADALEQLLIEGRGTLVLVPPGLRVGGQHQHMTIDTGGQREHAVQAAYEQRRTGEQQHGDRDLCGDNRPVRTPDRFRTRARSRSRP